MIHNVCVDYHPLQGAKTRDGARGLAAIHTRHERDFHSKENEWDRTGREGMRLNGNGIGFENTIDYCS